jgi:hypothetical protein
MTSRGTMVKRVPRPSAPKEMRRSVGTAVGTEPAKAPSRRTLGAADAFLERIAHPDGRLGYGEPRVDRMVAAAGNPPVDGSIVVAVGRAMALGLRRAQLGRVDNNDADSCRCGWWWCGRRADPTTSWKDLGDALAVLENHAIDPWSPSVADVGLSFRKMTAAGEHHADMDKLFNAIADLRVSGPAAEHQRRFLDEISTPHVLGMLATWREDGNTRSDQRPGYTAALNHARELGWTQATGGVVAAILLLVGTEKASFVSLRKRIEAADRRRRLPTRATSRRPPSRKI